MNVTALADAIAATVTEGSDVRCTADPSGFSPPCVLVDMPESVELRQSTGAAGEGGRGYIFPLLFLVANGNPRTVREQIETMLASVETALLADPDLGGVADSSVPVNVVQWAIQEVQGVECLTCVMRVEVWD